MKFKRKDLLGLAELSAEEINLILDSAVTMKEIISRPIKKVPALRGRVIVNVFYEPSTRTRVSFELAAKHLSADTVNISAQASSVLKGESLKDTACTIKALGADLVVIRHPMAGAAHLLAKTIDAAVVNAGDGAHEHPTQSLLDMFTVREKRGTLEGIKVVIVGDILHSRVARSNIWGFNKMGSRVAVCGPATMIPPEIKRIGVSVYHHMEAAIEGADVIMMLRIQMERQKTGFFPSLREYTRMYGLNLKRLSLAKPDALIMHPGPVNRGVEICNEAIEHPRSVHNEQVANGVAVRMAILYLLTGGEARDVIA